ncbi:MAG: cytidine deaminase [Gemmatimonadota bacterium]
MKTREETDLDIAELATCAHQAMERAYAPYSKFHVGAALEAEDGRVFGGCNVENASYPVSVCAERVALGAAVAAGAKRFRKIFICSSGADPVTPCGMCRQALSEFGVDLEVISEGTSGARQSWGLSELLPGHFGPGQLP